MSGKAVPQSSLNLATIEQKRKEARQAMMEKKK